MIAVSGSKMDVFVSMFVLAGDNNGWSARMKVVVYATNPKAEMGISIYGMVEYGPDKTAEHVDGFEQIAWLIGLPLSFVYVKYAVSMAPIKERKEISCRDSLRTLQSLSSISACTSTPMWLNLILPLRLLKGGSYLLPNSRCRCLVLRSDVAYRDFKLQIGQTSERRREQERTNLTTPIGKRVWKSTYQLF